MIILRAFSFLRRLVRLHGPRVPGHDLRDLVVAVDGDHRSVKEVCELVPDGITLRSGRHFETDDVLDLELLNRSRMFLRKVPMRVARVQPGLEHSWNVVGEFERILSPEELQKLRV